MTKRHDSPFRLPRFSVGSLRLWLVLPAAFLGLLFCAAVFGTVLALMPPAISAIALGACAVVVLWFFFARGRGSGELTEGRIMGTQASRGGLL